jgi:hypothetical protein
MVSIGLGVVRLWTDGLEEAAALLGAAATPDVPPGLPLHEQLYARLFKVLADYRCGGLGRGERRCGKAGGACR